MLLRTPFGVMTILELLLLGRRSGSELGIRSESVGC